MVCGVVSVTVIVCDSVEELLPHASTAIQVLVNVFAQVVPPVTSETIFTEAVLQLSDAVGAVNVGTNVCGQPSTVVFAPAVPMVGGVVSVTVIVCDTVEELLPQPSTATQVLVNVFAQVVPPVTPETIFTEAVLQLSVAVGAVNVGTKVCGHPSTVVFAPAVPMVGGVVSVTVIVCDTVEELLPHASTATHVLVNVFAQVVPPVTSEIIFTEAVLQLSDAVGAVNVGTKVCGHPSTVVFAPAVPIVGGVVSVTVIVCDTVPLELPHASTAIQVLVNVFAQVVPPVTSETMLTEAVLQLSDAVGAVNVGV